MPLAEFDHAIAVERGCGERETGGMYAEVGLSPYGQPIEAFLLDSPVPLPPGMDLINKPQIVANGAINHVFVWVGAEHYPYVSDFIEEAKRFGISRRLSPELDLAALTPGQSMLVLVHPRARVANWNELRRPRTCAKGVLGHGSEIVTAQDALADPQGPCLFKTWTLIPMDGATARVSDEAGGQVTCLRQHASTTYSYQPSGEHADAEYEPGIFGMFYLTGFALVKYADGSVNARARQRLDEAELPYYEADK